MTNLLSWSTVADDEISAAYRGETFSIIWASGKCKAYQAGIGWAGESVSDRIARGSIPISGWTTHDKAVATCERAAAALPKPLMELIDEYATAAYSLGRNDERERERESERRRIEREESNIRAEIVRRVAELGAK